MCRYGIFSVQLLLIYPSLVTGSICYELSETDQKLDNWLRRFRFSSLCFQPKEFLVEESG